VALRALGGFDDLALLARGLDALLTDDIRTSDVSYLLGAAYGRRATRRAAETWVRQHWEELRKKLPGSLGAGLVAGASMACTKSELEDSAAFYTPRAAQIEGAQRRLDQELERAALCASLRAFGAGPLTRDLLNGDKKAPAK